MKNNTEVVGTLVLDKDQHIWCIDKSTYRSSRQRTDIETNETLILDDDFMNGCKIIKLNKQGILSNLLSGTDTPTDLDIYNQMQFSRLYSYLNYSKGLKDDKDFVVLVMLISRNNANLPKIVSKCEKYDLKDRLNFVLDELEKSSRLAPIVDYEYYAELKKLSIHGIYTKLN